LTPTQVDRIVRARGTEFGGGPSVFAQRLPLSPLAPVTTPLPARPRLARWMRRLGFALVNLWLVYHLAGIILAPWSVPPASRLVQNSWRAVGAYDQALFLNHGYHYFAPEPGNSTLVAYVLEMPDGSRVTGKIPNPGIKPRLFYHRHFMLTEYLGSDDLSPSLRDELVRAMARELCREYHATRVTLSRVTHRLPSMEFVRAGGTLDDPESYSEEPLGTFSSDGRLIVDHTSR
jgi:hypothetical protein